MRYYDDDEPYLIPNKYYIYRNNLMFYLFVVVKCFFIFQKKDNEALYCFFYVNTLGSLV